MATTIRYVARLAPAHDDDFVGAHDSERARALLDRIVGEPVQRHATRTRRRLAVVALPVVSLVVAATVAVIVFAGADTAVPASAATVLRHAARTAAEQTPLVVGPGQYLYTKSVDAFTTTSDGTSAGTGWTAVLPQTRETWLGPDGGRLHTTWGTPFFLSERDHAHWIAAGSPEITGSPKEIDLGPLQPVNLPDDPDRLYAKLQAETVSYGQRQSIEMFTLIGDSLRETNATPAQRAALYAVAARLPGVQLVGPVTDSVGRNGVAVAMDDVVNRERQTLVFDPDTAALLEEREVTLSDNSFGYPAGTKIGSATYLVQAVVGSMTATP